MNEGMLRRSAVDEETAEHYGLRRCLVRQLQ